MVAEKRIALLPLRVSLVFLVFSEVLLLIGPFNYDISNYPLLFLYFVIVNLAFYFGFKKGLNNSKQSAFSLSESFVYILLIVGLLLTFRRMVNLWEHRGLTVSIYSIIYALGNSGDVYHNAVEIESTSSMSLFWLILEPIRCAAIPLGIGNWKKLKIGFRVVCILTIVIEILAWLGIGTRKGLFDVIVIVLFIAIAAAPQWILDKSKRRKLITISTIAIIAFLFYFVISGASRRGYQMNEINTITVSQEIKPSFQDAPDWLLYSMCSIESYLCQGYYALSKGLELGIRPVTFGGSGWFTMMLMRKIGYDPEPNIYMVSLEQYGIDRHINWHSIYLWLANDVTFIGVPFVIFLIGYLFAISWKDVLYGKNQVAYPFFSLMLIMVFYFYANNQVMSFSFVPLVFWSIFYYITRLNSKKT